MSVRDGLIVALREEPDADPLWMRIVDGAIAQTGEGPNWLAACGLTALPDGSIVMLVPPAAMVTLHWIAHPDLPVRQGRAAARLAALTGSIVPADSLFAAADDNVDPAQPHLVGVAARADMQHWLLWAQHHGLDPDVIVPAALLLPEPEEGFARATIGGVGVLRGRDMAMSADMMLPPLIGETPVRDVPPAVVNDRAIAALGSPPLDLRQGDYAKREQRAVDVGAIKRIAVWSGCILLASLLIALVGLAKDRATASRLDARSLELARQILPQANDVAQADAEMDRLLAARGAGGRAFTAPLSGLMAAMQRTPGVALTALSRDPDGMLRATLASAKVEDINNVLLAVQAAGFTITATSSQAPDGRTLADVTVRP